MKTFWSLLAKILIIVVIVQAWFLYDYYNKNQQLIAENIQLETELLQTKESLLAAEEKAADLEKRSLEGVLKETNKAVVSGWEKLLDAVEGELNKAREAIEEIQEPATEQPDEQKPNGGDEGGVDNGEDPPSTIDIPEPIQGERT